MSDKFICMFARNSMLRLPPAIDEGHSLANKKFAVKCIALKANNLPRCQLVTTKFKIYRMSLLTKWLPQWRIFRPFRYFEYTLKSILKSNIFSLHKDFCLCIAHDLPAILPAYIVAKMKRVPIVFRMHELYTEGKEGRIFYWRYLEKYFWKHVDGVIVPNKERAEFLIKKYGQPKKLRVIMNVPPYSKPIKANKFRKFLKKKGILNMSNIKIILYAGGLSWDRSAEELIDSGKSFLTDNIIIILMGWGEDNYLRKLKEKIINLKLDKKVFLHPPVSYTEVMEYISSADIGVVLYKPIEKNAYYCASHKMFDYIMCGKPVIASNSPPLKNLIEKKNIGICVDPFNPKSIAQGILHIIHNPVKYKMMSENALRLANEKYNWGNEFQKLYTFYRGLMGKR